MSGDVLTTFIECTSWNIENFQIIKVEAIACSKNTRIKAFIKTFTFYAVLKANIHNK